MPQTAVIKITDMMYIKKKRRERKRAHHKEYVITIDASRSFVHERTGIEEYAYQLVKHLRAPLRFHHVVLYVRFAGAAARNPRAWIEKHFFALPDAWHVRVIGLRRAWTQVGLAFSMWRDRPDALLVPAHTVPWVHPRNTVVVVHGLEYEMTPQAYSVWARQYMRTTIRLSCRWARRIITVSENTRRDVARLYGVAPAKMRVVYEGVNAAPPARAQDAAMVAARVGDAPYFFFVGRLEERKNIARVVAAFDAFKARTGLPHKLVLAGGRGYGYAHVAAAIARAQHTADIVEMGFVSDGEKWALMRGAMAFVFPTLYEGFGLPVLEAQSVGVPVVTSGVSSLPEVAGDSALLVDPTDTAAISAALERLATDDALRHDIIARGHANLAHFSWARCAHEVAACITEKDV